MELRSFANSDLSILWLQFLQYQDPLAGDGVGGFVALGHKAVPQLFCVPSPPAPQLEDGKPVLSTD